MVKYRSRQYKKIEVKENRGAYGAWRREFCKKYLEMLIRLRKNTYNSFIEILASNGEAITCRKGCVYCCFEHVAVSIAHGIVIVDYLYDRKELLKKFIHNYEKWRHKGRNISDSIDRVRIQAAFSFLPVESAMAAIGPLSARYVDMNIPCPFLAGNRCFIYNVRPLPCSGHYSVSLPSWCASNAAQKPVVHQLIPNKEDMSNIVRLADPQYSLYELTLPTMIYKLLTKGSSSILKGQLISPVMVRE